MAIFLAIGKPDLTILVFDFGIVQVIENIFYVMFAFWWRSLHVYKDVSYVDDNIVLSFVYQVPDVNFERMFWMVTNGRYRIIGEHALNNFQYIVLTPGTTVSMANIATKASWWKNSPIQFPMTWSFLSQWQSFHSSTLWFFWWRWPILSGCGCPSLCEFSACQIANSAFGYAANNSFHQHFQFIESNVFDLARFF